MTDAFGVLVILLVPVVMLQKLAITASWWILAITVSEMLLNPIVYYYLKAPGAGARHAARARRVPQLDRPLRPACCCRPSGMTAAIVAWLAVCRRRPLLHARPDHR